MGNNKTKYPPRGEVKRLNIRIEGKGLSRWHELLRQEGGTQQHHAQAALEAYCVAKGYGPKTN